MQSVPSPANCRQCQHPCLPVHSVLRDWTGSWRRPPGYAAAMIEIARDAPGTLACGRSGLPLLAVCPCGRRRLIPFRLLKTSDGDRTLLYGRPFKCQECGRREVTLFNIESRAELDEIQRSLAEPRQPAKAPTTHARLDPDEGLL
jgi:hypothetical protein